MLLWSLAANAMMYPNAAITVPVHSIDYKLAVNELLQPLAAAAAA